ncbi:hypothetical protein ACFL5H_01420 [Candidatus Latescibacterota bacterium]
MKYIQNSRQINIAFVFGEPMVSIKYISGDSWAPPVITEQNINTTPTKINAHLRIMGRIFSWGMPGAPSKTPS